MESIDKTWSSDDICTADLTADVDRPSVEHLPDEDNLWDVDFSEVSFVDLIRDAGDDTDEPVAIEDVRARPLTKNDPQTIGPYQILSTFCSSTFARVYLACRMTPHGVARPAVLKFVPVGDFSYREFRDAMVDEARALSSFNHPNLVSILDTGEDSSGAYMALEYIQGTDLGRVMCALRKQKRRLPVEMACYVAVSVLRGLHHAHSAMTHGRVPLGIVHRDVNPPNVLVSNAGHIKLADFGIVRMNDRRQEETQPGVVKGKFAYLAPEYITSNTMSPQVDIYAVGVTLFELLTGERCFSEQSQMVLMRRIVHEGVPFERLLRHGVPAELVGIVRRATHPRTEARFLSASAMAAALELWMAHERVYVSGALFRNFLASRPYSISGIANEIAFG